MDCYRQKLGTSTAELDHTKEICEGVLQQLQSTWDLTSPDLKRIAKAINVEEEEVGTASVLIYYQVLMLVCCAQVMIEVYKRMKAARVGRKKHKKNAAPPVPNPQEAAEPIESSDLRESLEHYFQLYEKGIDSYRSKSFALYLLVQSDRTIDSTARLITALFCRKCCVYDCDYHGCIGAAKLVSHLRSLQPPAFALTLLLSLVSNRKSLSRTP